MDPSSEQAELIPRKYTEATSNNFSGGYPRKGCIWPPAAGLPPPQPSQELLHGPTLPATHSPDLRAG